MCSPPRAFEDNTKKALEELIEAGVIVEQNKPTVWCSPAHWVPKKDCGEEKNRCRLVVDFKRLNDSISRPVRGFPTIQELRQQVKHDSKYFACMDLTQSYHQIKLTEEASNYTTFMVSCGE